MPIRRVNGSEPEHLDEINEHCMAAEKTLFCVNHHLCCGGFLLWLYGIMICLKKTRLQFDKMSSKMLKQILHPFEMYEN